MKIVNTKWSLLMVSLMGLFSSCSSDVDYGEQYHKTIYIVNSQGMLYAEDHNFKPGAELDTAVVSIYCAGTEPIKGDLTVSVEIDKNALDSLNKMGHVSSSLYVDKVMLPEDRFTLLSKDVTIAKGQQYKPLYIEFDAQGLDPEISYVIPVSITGNSANYAVNPEMKTMIYHIRMINGYSGNFSGSSTDNNIRPVQPELKAISHNQVRMPIHNLDDEVTYLDTNFMLLTIADDSTTVSISPWKNAKVTDKGGSTFDTKTQLFILNYSFTNTSGKEVDVVEKIRNIENDYEEEIEVDE